MKELVVRVRRKCKSHVAQNPLGRGLTSYTPELGDMICNGLLEGRTLASMCKKNGLPAMSVVLRWLHTHEEFNELYYKARQLQMELIIDGLLEISDDKSKDYTDVVDEHTGETKRVFNHEHVARSRLKIDTRKFLAAKLAPRIYGERMTIDHQGGVKASLVIMDSGSGSMTLEHENNMKVIEPPK